MTDMLRSDLRLTKRDLLLYDHIYIVGLQQLLGDLGVEDDQDRFAIEWLTERDIIRDYAPTVADCLDRVAYLDAVSTVPQPFGMGGSAMLRLEVNRTGQQAAIREALSARISEGARALMDSPLAATSDRATDAQEAFIRSSRQAAGTSPFARGVALHLLLESSLIGLGAGYMAGILDEREQILRYIEKEAASILPDLNRFLETRDPATLFLTSATLPLESLAYVFAGLEGMAGHTMVTDPRSRIGPTRAESLLDPLDRQSQIIVEVVAPQIPLPDDSVPLEAIVDFREDSMARDTLLRLRSWISRAALEGSSLTQINRDVIDLRRELEQALSKKGISRKPHRLIALVVAVAGLLEELRRGNVGTATKETVALVRSTERHLLSDPQTAGSEVGYILLAERRFAAD